MQAGTTPLMHPVSAACARLGIGKTFFYELVKDREIRTVKLGNKTLVPESELVRLVSKHMQAAA